MDEHLLILGASTRAAAFSALRAGLRPWCADLFGDLDLRARCPVKVLASEDYPSGFVQLVNQAPPGAWIYTGALENRPALVRRLARMRRLWGNDASVLAAARNPRTLERILRTAGLPCPSVSVAGVATPSKGRWLIKPKKGSGGKGIQFLTSKPLSPGERSVYYQEYIEGEPCAAIYVSDGTVTRLLGVTRQLVGESWLHAEAFHYCGSIGPLPLTPSLREAFECLGTVLARGSRLLGLFGIDCILRDGIPWPVEINPRYTASVEVLEYARGFSALDWQRYVFEPTAQPRAMRSDNSNFVGKGIFYAKRPLLFPADGPWLATLQSPQPVHQLPAFADIPPAGQQIRAGRPILTFFASGNSLAACQENLRRTAADLDPGLFGG
jgi:predicted ATP-grasp superfamily ATP-dependent carboligase